MGFLNRDERRFLLAVSNLGYCNPFLPERIEYERELLGPDFREGEPVWAMRVDDPDSQRVNPLKIMERIETVVRRLREQLASGTVATEEELVLYPIEEPSPHPPVADYTSPDGMGKAPLSGG